MNEDKIRIKQYEQTADEKVSLNGIKWLRKWDVCVQCDSAEAAEALRARLAQPEPAECDGGQCGIGGYCKQCPKTKPDVPETAFGETKPVAWMYKGEPWFDGTIWHDQSEVTTHKRVAMFKDKNAKPLYTAPPQREWVGLRDKEIEDCLEMSIQGTCRAIEAKLKEKNT